MRACVFIGGQSGSGKTVLASRVGVPVLSLDVFFRSAQEVLPTWLGQTDWNHLCCFDASAAARAVQALLFSGETEIPEYDLASDRIVGRSNMSVVSGGFIAEGVFAPAVIKICSMAPTTANRTGLVMLEAGLIRTATSKVRRDLAESRLGLRRSLAAAVRLAVRTPDGQGPSPDAVRCTREDGIAVVRRVLVDLGGVDATHR